MKPSKTTRLLAAMPVAALLALASGAQAQDVGVAQCDDFLKKYSACVGAKVPAEQKDVMTKAMAAIRTNWAEVAKTPDGKAQLAGVCQKTADQLKQQVASLNCAW